jgi:hypothetical protein
MNALCMRLGRPLVERNRPASFLAEQWIAETPLQLLQRLAALSKKSIGQAQNMALEATRLEDYD